MPADGGAPSPVLEVSQAGLRSLWQDLRPPPQAVAPPVGGEVPAGPGRAQQGEGGREDRGCVAKAAGRASEYSKVRVWIGLDCL